MKLKEFKIDLGGSFPEKSRAVRRHAIPLGYKGVYVDDFNELRFIGLENAPCSIFSTDNSQVFYEIYNGKLITTEKFLELTKEDVTVKEAELYYRYRIWFKDGDIVEAVNFLKEMDGSFWLASGRRGYSFSDIDKFERIGEGVAKVSDQV